MSPADPAGARTIVLRRLRGRASISLFYQTALMVGTLLQR